MIVWAFETLIASTLLMLLVLALRAPVRRSFGPNIAYALWALPAIRMAMPALPGDWGLSRLVAPLVRPVSEGPDVVMGVLDPSTLPPAVAHAPGVVEAGLAFAGRSVELAVVPPMAAAGGAPMAVLVLGLWALGALAFIGYHLVSHSRFCARVWEKAASVRTVAGGNVAVVETDAAAGPLAFGVWRKYVAFPRDFAERYDPLERDLALAHELGHHARGDLIANWIALIVLGLHWFNPVAWRAFRAFRADQEMACDALVLSGRAPELRHAYGRAIVKSAHGGAVSAACHLHTINEIKGRLKMLTVHAPRSRRRLLTGGAAIGALTFAGLGVTASGTHAAERVRSKVESTIGVDLAAIDLPLALQQAPVAPDAPAAPGALPPLPPVPPAPEADGAAKVRKHIRIVQVGKDGKVQEYSSDGARPAADKDGRVVSRRFVFRDKDGKLTMMDGAGPVPPMPPMPPMPPEALAKLRNMPEVLSRTCGGGESKDMVIDSRDGEKRRIIICTDRIERQSAMAEKQAELAVQRGERARARGEWAERNATASALEGLRRARRSVEQSRGLTGEQRASALAGIDDAIRDMEAEKD